MLGPPGWLVSGLSLVSPGADRRPLWHPSAPRRHPHTIGRRSPPPARPGGPRARPQQAQGPRGRGPGAPRAASWATCTRAAPAWYYIAFESRPHNKPGRGASSRQADGSAALGPVTKTPMETSIPERAFARATRNKVPRVQSSTTTGQGHHHMQGKQSGLSLPSFVSIDTGNTELQSSSLPP